MSLIPKGSSAKTGWEFPCLQTCWAGWPEPYTADPLGCRLHHLLSVSQDKSHHVTRNYPFVFAINSFNMLLVQFSDKYKLKKKSFIYLPSLSFSLSSFLLFLLDDLLWEDCDAPVCPELPELPPEKDEEEELATTLLPQRAQESSCKSTGETPSSTRKLTCSRKYRTAAWKRRWKEERNKMKKCCHRWGDFFLAVPKFILQYVQSSFMQNFCQLIVLCVAISAQAFRCSICNKLRRIIVTKHRTNRSPKWKPCETIEVAAKRTLTRLMRVSYWSAEPDVAVTTPALRKMPCSSKSFLMLRTWESRVCRSLSCRYFSFEPQINSSSFLTCLLTNGVCWIIRYWGNGKVKINRLHWGRLVNTGWKGKTKNSSDDELVLTSER